MFVIAGVKCRYSRHWNSILKTVFTFAEAGSTIFTSGVNFVIAHAAKFRYSRCYDKRVIGNWIVFRFACKKFNNTHKGIDKKLI